MTPYVLDASVAAKWYLPPRLETLVEEAALLRRRYDACEVQFFVPDLFFVELANIFWKAERRGNCDPATSDAALAEILGQRFPSFPAPPLLPQARRIARDFGRTAYDSLYIALAVELGATLVTADERLVNAVRGRLPVAWLGELW